MGEYDLYNPSVNNSQDSLAHYGILGMKWGVRRYQNPDGSLTPLGRKRFGYAKKHPLLDTMAAKSVYKKKSKESDRLSKTLSKMSDEQQKKADKLKNVDAEKASEHELNAIKYSKNSEVYKQLSDIYSQKVKDIDSGVLKAGEDFIVQVDKNWYGLFSTRERRIIERPMTRESKNDPLYDNVMDTYEVRAKGEQLKPEHKKVKDVEGKLDAHRNDFYKKNPPDSESFKNHLENRLKEMTTNDADGDEMKALIRQETKEAYKNGRGKSSSGFDMAYADYCRNDSAYKKLNEKLSTARDAYDAKANKLATASYKKHGADAIDEWDIDNVSQRAPKYAINVLEYLMKESCEGRR